MFFFFKYNIYKHLTKTKGKGIFLEWPVQRRGYIPAANLAASE